MHATYNITNDRIMFTPPPGRLAPEQDKERRAANFVWWPGRKVFSAVWSPQAESFVLSFGIEIDQDDSPDDVEARVERFDGYAQNAEKSAESAAAYAADPERANTERLARLAQQRAASEAERAEYWTARIAASIRHAAYKDRPDVIARRIKELEKRARRHQKEYDQESKFLTLWKQPITQERAEQLANYGHYYTESGSLWGQLNDRKITPEDAQVIAIQQIEHRMEHARVWLEHLNMRLQYERAYLEGMGGDPVAKLDGLNPGDKVIWRGELCTVEKVNKTTVSVIVPSRHWLTTGMKVDKTELKPQAARNETERKVAAELLARCPDLAAFGTLEAIDIETGYAAAFQGRPCNAYTGKINGEWHDIYTSGTEVLGVVKHE